MNVIREETALLTILVKRSQFCDVGIIFITPIVELPGGVFFVKQDEAEPVGSVCMN